MDVTRSPAALESLSFRNHNAKPQQRWELGPVRLSAKLSLAEGQTNSPHQRCLQGPAFSKPSWI